jgi:hypothetical protein
MNESDCKLITEKLLGEEYVNLNPFKGWVNVFASNRTFQDPQDFFACFEKLVELGEWNEFDEWAYMKWDQLKPFNDLSRHLGEHSQWLLSRTESGEFQMCQLVSEWLKEKTND